VFIKSPGAPAFVVLDWRKIGALDANFQQATVSESVKVSTVLALASSSSFYSAQIACLLKRFETGNDLITAACSLYVKCIDLEDGVDTIMNSVPARDVRRIKEKLGYRATFRGSNPTGHYELVRVATHFRTPTCFTRRSLLPIPQHASQLAVMALSRFVTSSSWQHMQHMHSACEYVLWGPCRKSFVERMQDLNVPHQYLLAIRLRDQSQEEGEALTWRNIMCAVVSTCLCSSLSLNAAVNK
jgi:hypothetical protein